MKRKGAEIIVAMLEKHGIQELAGIPGGSNLPIYRALADSSIKHILCRHEQGAGFIAQGIARSTGRVGVCIATSGPGATNLITALADAKSDSVPIIAITGQVPINMIGTDAFQEVDICSMSKNIVKKAYQINSVSQIIPVFYEAFQIAKTGRPGPVLIDIPKDIQTTEFEYAESITQNQENTVPSVNNSMLEEFVSAIEKSRKPVIYAGGGIINSGSGELLLQFARKNSVPVTTTLMGLGCFPADDELYLGMPGMHGSRATNYLLHEADLLLAFGVRFDDRVTGRLSEFCPDAKVIHIDIDTRELGKIRKPEINIHADIKDILEKLLPLISYNTRKTWRLEIEKLKREFGICVPQSNSIFHPVNFIKAVNSFADPDTIITTDVGQHQMWVAQHYKFKKPRTLLTSGGQGTMGFGLPAAIGAAVANPDRKVIAFCGDGSILMNIQELATLADLKANVHIIVMNNGQLGLVRQQQELFYDRKFVGSSFETRVDYALAARAFGINSFNLAQSNEPMETLEYALNTVGPCLIDAPIEDYHNVYPMVPPGAANIQMIGK